MVIIDDINTSYRNEKHRADAVTLVSRTELIGVQPEVGIDCNYLSL